jgi:hypothetical protein
MHENIFMNFQRGKAPGLPPLPKSGVPPPVPNTSPTMAAVALPQLRPLFWHTFPPPSDRTCVWDDVDVSVSGVSELVKDAEKHLVALFAYNQKKDNGDPLAPKRKDRRLSLSASHPKNSPMANSTPALVMNGKRLMKVLDDRKTQNLAIALRRFPEPEAVMDAITSVDTTTLSGEQVALLLQEFPSTELCAEIERVENSHPEEDDHMFEWDKPEQYLLVMACVSNCREILTVWSFAVNMNRGDSDPTPSSGSNIRQQLTDFVIACDAVCNSTSLRSFLAIMREIGNRMNVNTPRGNAKGVAIESILQFDDLKSTGGGQATTVSLFSIVVDIWLKKNPDDYHELVDQLRAVRELRVPSLHDIELEIAKQNEAARKASDALKKYYEEVEDETAMATADKLKYLSDPVLKEIKGNSDVLQKSKNAWNKCQSYFCIKSESLLGKNTNDFFEHWRKVLKVMEKYAPKTN